MEKIALCLEDDEKMPISQALKLSYNGANVYFSGGNDFLAEKMHECIMLGYSFVIGLIDYPPDNPYVRITYEDAIKYLVRNDLIENALLLPVVCTEFYVLLVLEHLKCITLGKNYIDVWERIKKGKQHLVSNKSLEKVCKSVLGSSSRDCQRNTNRGRMGGLFYTLDCTNCSKHCFDFTKGFKDEWIYSGLPCFDVVSAEHKALIQSYDIPLKTLDKTQLIMETTIYFQQLYKEYGEEFSVL